MGLNFLKKFLTYGFGNILQSALGLLLLPLYLRFLAPEEYGVVSVLSVSLSLLALSISAGAMNGLIRLYYEVEGAKKKSLLGTTWLWYFAIGALGGLVLLTQSRPLASLLFHGLAHTRVIRIVGVVFFSLMLRTVPFYVLRLEKKATQYVGYSLFGFLVDFGLKFYLIVSLHRGIEGYFESSAIANLLTVTVMIPVIAKNIRLDFEPATLQQLLRLGIPYVFSGIAVWTLDVSDRLLLNHFSGQAVVGIYAVSYNFANVFGILLATPSSLLVDPYFFSFAAAKPPEETKRLLQRMLIYSLLAGGILYLAISLSSGDVLRIFARFGARKEYLAASNLVPVLTLAPFVYFLVMPSILGGLWVKNPKIFSIACVCGAVANAGLNFFIIPRFGAAGAAATTVAAYLLLFAISYGGLQRVLKGGYEWRKVCLLLFYLAIAFTVSWQIKINQPMASLLVRVTTGLFIFASLTLFTSDVLKGEWNKLRSSYLESGRLFVKKPAVTSLPPK